MRLQIQYIRFNLRLQALVERVQTKQFHSGLDAVSGLVSRLPRASILASFAWQGSEHFLE
jgi:hypothetical protein